MDGWLVEVCAGVCWLSNCVSIFDRDSQKYEEANSYNVRIAMSKCLGVKVNISELYICKQIESDEGWAHVKWFEDKDLVQK